MVLFNDQGGGQALPPFLQGRTAANYRSPFQTRPMITPKASIVPGEVRPNIAPTNPFGIKPQTGAYNPVQGQYAGGVKGPNITPNINLKPNLPTGGLPGLNVQPTVPGGQPDAKANDTKTLFEFLKKDLENERNKALSGAQSDAASRGVYYGTPLTTSEGDINTSFLRGLGQLQAGMIQNQDQNELAKLGLATNLIGSPASYSELANTGAPNPDVYSTIGSLFAGQQAPNAGPQITPNAPGAPGAAVQKPVGQPIQSQPTQQPFKPPLPFRPGQQTPTPLKPFVPNQRFF